MTEPAAVICLVHGLGEHSGRYAHVAAILNQAGFTVAAFDLRGHGRSDGSLGHAAGFEVLINDISDFVKAVQTRCADQPTFLYGHSFGGSLVLNFALRTRTELRGVIATAPGLRPAFAVPLWKRVPARVLYHLWPSYSLSNGFDVHDLSRDPKVVEIYKADPLVHDRISARLAIDFLEAGSWALKNASEFPNPLLLMHGSADRITSSEASREFGTRVGKDCEVKIWEGLCHEIHNEPEKEQVYQYLPLAGAVPVGPLLICSVSHQGDQQYVHDICSISHRIDLSYDQSGSYLR